MARAGTIALPHGVVQTPAFMPVGTAGAVKGAFHSDIYELGYRLMLANTYHLYLRPGTDVIEESGGLHRFTGWHGNLLTDSGGYQIFSLSDFRKLRDDGVEFRSHIDGSYHTLTPESVVGIQEVLGSDIQMVLDVCTGYDASRSEAEQAVELTTKWAARARRAWERCGSDYAGVAFGIVQGHFHPDLRQRSASEIVELDFPGYALGGLSVGEPFDLFRETMVETARFLPWDRPRYVMGIGTPEYVLEAIGSGVDMFDCVFPTRIARNGTVFTRDGRIALKNERFRYDFGPLDPEWSADSVREYSRAYVRHMLMSREMIGPMIGTLHNLGFLARLVAEARKAIARGDFDEFRTDFLRRYAGSADE